MGRLQDDTNVARGNHILLGPLIISKEGVATDPQKIEGVTNWPPPTNLKQLRGFLGLFGYYRRFISDYAKLSQP